MMDRFQELKSSHCEHLAYATVTTDLLAWAIAEIEHLRSVAGAVSQGSSFAEIRMKGADVIRAGMKAFDGFDGA